MSKTRAILAAVFDDAPPAEACQACQAGLAAFVEAELDGQAAAGLFPIVAKHLETCVTCRQEYIELKSLFTSERQGGFEQPPVPAAFDFGYLQIGPFSEERSNLTPQDPAAFDFDYPQIGPFSEERSNLTPENPAARQPWRLDTLGRLVIQFSVDLLRSLQPPALQLSYLKGDAPASLNYALTDQIDDLNVRISVEPSRRDPQRTSVEVEVDIPSRGGWPNLAGSTVTLRRGAEQLLEEQETDAFGKASFEDVSAEDLPLLVFEIAVA